MSGKPRSFPLARDGVENAKTSTSAAIRVGENFLINFILKTPQLVRHSLILSVAQAFNRKTMSGGLRFSGTKRQLPEVVTNNNSLKKPTIRFRNRSNSCTNSAYLFRH